MSYLTHIEPHESVLIVNTGTGLKSIPVLPQQRISVVEPGETLEIS